jgi:hypothetical protein
MPGPDGKPHTMRLILRTAGENRDISPFDDAIKDYPLRMASASSLSNYAAPTAAASRCLTPTARSSPTPSTPSAT